jgi:hypothetical protein
MFSLQQKSENKMVEQVLPGSGGRRWQGGPKNVYTLVNVKAILKKPSYLQL